MKNKKLDGKPINTSALLTFMYGSSDPDLPLDRNNTDYMNILPTIRTSGKPIGKIMVVGTAEEIDSNNQSFKDMWHE